MPGRSVGEVLMCFSNATHLMKVEGVSGPKNHGDGLSSILGITILLTEK